MLKLKGYAMGSDSQVVAGVEIAIQTEEGDRGEWMQATIMYQKSKWSWTLWDCVLDVHLAKAEVERKGGERKSTFLCRARDEKRDCAWNMRGVAFNAYGKWTWQW